jgi:DNA-binding MarR family transcriptional regulator
MTKQAVNYLLGQLEQLGYLVRKDDDEDHRSERIKLAPRGHGVMKTIRAIVSEVESGWEHELGRESFTQLPNLLRQLTVLTGADPKTPAT